MKKTLSFARASSLVALMSLGVAACSDIPLLPEWDTEWSFPLVSRTSDRLFGALTVTVRPGAAFNVSFPAVKVQLDERLQALLGRQMTNASLVISISKVLQVAGNYTLAVASDSAGLHVMPDSGIALRFAISQVAHSTTDSADFSVAGLAMLQGVANSKGVLWIQLRGRTTYGGPGDLVIAPTDSINVQLTLRATIASSN